MNNTLVFLRHGSSVKEVNVPIENWRVSDEGLTKVGELAESGIFDDVDLIYSSCEKKAIQTAQPFAQRLKKRIIKVLELGELKRPGSESLPTEVYKNIKRKVLEDFNFTTDNWETANQALDRFSRAIGKIEAKSDSKKILIVSHGTVMTLYFASLQNQLGNIFSRWGDLEFGSWGVVKNDKVIKDIV